MEKDRIAKNQILSKLSSEVAVVLYGARRTGKTTLLKQLFEEYDGKKIYINAEDPLDRIGLYSDDMNLMLKLLEGFELLIIDEAQVIKDIGKKLKYIIDSEVNLKIVVAGSASFDLINKIGEPLTGRKVTIKMYPFSYEELNPTNVVDRSIISNSLIFGSYPALESLVGPDNKIEYLNELIDSYLLKDILEFEDIKNSRKIRDLLMLLAYQIGSLVSLTELGSQLDLHKDTVQRYLDILEKTFVIYRLSGFSRNLRKEITKMSKYYFVDNGIRNALILNFSQLEKRDDIGKLWENYLMSERMKYLDNNRKFVNRYFWRTYDQQEIDLIEDQGGHLNAFEFKWIKNNKNQAPTGFSKNYIGANYKIVIPTEINGFINKNE